jgi:hypothetical protein
MASVARDGGSQTEAPLTASSLAGLSDAELMERAVEVSEQVAALTGRLVQLAGELDRRQGWRAEGATSLEGWIAARTGASVPTARAQAHVAERLFDLPHLAAGLASGELSFDKVRAVVDGATPSTDAELAARAKTCTVRELADLARAARRRADVLGGEQGGAGASAGGDAGEPEYEKRSVRFNDTFRTVTAQLPAVSYAEVRAAVEAGARQVPSDGDTPWDQRLADSFLSLVREGGGAGQRRGGCTVGIGATPYTVVAHAPLDVLLDEGSELLGELERDGLVAAETVRRLACDATFVIAVDDQSGHTMYEGRQRRYPSAAQRREIMRRDRHCRFPGCANVTFVHPHHIKRWKPDRGPTDLPNLALLCDYHHHLMHSKAWTMSGDANGELTFVGPTGRAMTSRPSPLWTLATGETPSP